MLTVMGGGGGECPEKDNEEGRLFGKQLPGRNGTGHARCFPVLHIYGSAFNASFKPSSNKPGLYGGQPLRTTQLILARSPPPPAPPSASNAPANPHDYSPTTHFVHLDLCHASHIPSSTTAPGSQPSSQRVNRRITSAGTPVLL